MSSKEPAYGHSDRGLSPHTHTQARIKMQRVEQSLWWHYCSLKHISRRILGFLCIQGDLGGVMLFRLISSLQMFSALSDKRQNNQKASLYCDCMHMRNNKYYLMCFNKLPVFLHALTKIYRFGPKARKDARTG